MILLIIASYFLCQVLGDPVPVRDSNQGYSRNTNQLIVGDTDSTIENYPWLISIETTNGHFCDGSILSESVILTTGICASTFSSKRNLTVRAGSSTINSGGTTHEVVTTVIHENFQGVYGHLVGNLAVMKVSPPFQFSSRVAKVQLPKAGHASMPAHIEPGANVDAFGHPSKKTKLRIEKIAECEREFETKLQGHICARAIAPYRSGNCLNSGAPVVDDGVLLGIQNFSGCSAPYHPDIYVNISYHLDWITKNLQSLDPPTQATKPEKPPRPILSSSIFGFPWYYLLYRATFNIT